MFRNSIFIFVLLVATSAVSGELASADTPKLPTEYSFKSDYQIRYDDWDLFLSGFVLDTGPSDRRPASQNGNRHTATRIRHGNTRSTAFEGNRVVFEELKPEYLEGLTAIRQDLEAVPDFVPFEKLSRNEQLAYWLNLHNVAVMIEVAKEYPVKKLKSLSRGRKSVWDDKTMLVAGVPTSIQDIEEHVIENWQDPIVLYGLFMGTVGGPNIRDHAYTGQNVRGALELNAKEFVNSLRGFRLWSGRGRVSEHYELGRKYFPDFEKDIARHLRSYARADTARDLAKASSFRVDSYDWHIADMSDGSVFKGSSFNTSSAALAWFIQSKPNSSGDSGGGTPAGAGVIDSFVNDPAFNRFQSTKISPQTASLLRAMKERGRRLREGNVTVEEFLAPEGGRVERRSGDGEARPKDDDGKVI